MNSNTFWKLLLVSSLLVVILGLYALNNLNYLNISGDGVPNRPQKEPPIEYPWDQAVQIIVIVVLSAITTLYSMAKILRLRLAAKRNQGTF
jgi:ABC-type lipoprotein release transport system permease subunit